MRNMIYRYTLVKPEPITVAAGAGAGATQPALLMTNRQIRAEALDIFLAENWFDIIIQDLKLTIPPTHWYRLYRRRMTKRMIGLQGAPVWENLMGWARKWHDGDRFMWPELPDSGESHWKAAVGALDIVLAMRKVEWSVVESVLERYKEGTHLGALGWRWT